MAVTVRIEVDEHVRDKAARNLADCGLTIGEAMRIVLVQAAAGRDLDLGPLAPNRTTMDAINAARRGELVDLGSPAAVIAELNEPG